MDDFGVYALYQNDELVYIGKTFRSFEVRLTEHAMIIQGLQGKPRGMILYQHLKPTDNIEYEILFSAKESGQKLTNRDIEAIEMAFIQLYKPKYNYVGLDVPYEFTKKRRKRNDQK